MSYPGGKNGAGVYQRIINLMPPHNVYIEPFLGGGAVMRHKKPAKMNYGLDKSAEAVGHFLYNLGNSPAYQFHVGDALRFLGNEAFSKSHLIYCDPPYLLETRKSGWLYKHEMEDEHHIQLLKIITKLPCMVMISGYWSKLYADALKDWNYIQFEAMTRSGKTATETLWFNFEKPMKLHDYSYLGEGFRERERIKRKKQRWVAKLKAMPELERQAILSAMDESWADSPTAGSGDGGRHHQK